MKDLYRRIGLPAHTADRAAIERAILAASRTDAEAARAARYILLESSRKEVYDRTRSVVLRVGQLRANLGLARAQNWLASDCSDFNTSSSSRVSQLELLRARLNPDQDERKRRGIARRIALGFGALVLSTCIIGVLLSNKPNGSGAPTGSRAPSTYPQQPALTPTPTKPALPVETRSDKVRKFVTTRFERAGIAADSATVDAAVQRIVQGQADLLPSTGVLKRSFYGQVVAPLEIKTRAGANYYVKVVDWTSKAEILTAFVRGGQPFETTVPVGSYEIKYAVGQTWFGSVLDFGEGASYSRCDDRFDFTETPGGYNGYTIDLILQQSGNLQTDPISPNDF